MLLLLLCLFISLSFLTRLKRKALLIQRLSFYYTIYGVSMLVKVQNGKDRLDVEVEGITQAQYTDISDSLITALQRETKAYIAVGQAMMSAVTLCPDANPADLWVHVIYHEYRERYGKSDQSWKRVSGDALEYVFINIYGPRLALYGITIRKGRASDSMALGLNSGGFGGSKTDIVLEGIHNGFPVIFGVLHSKSSIAERLADDMPASRFLVDKGFWSSVVTMDGKMFPPPHGNAVVNGELKHTKGNDKRRYFEINGAFSNCYSFNLHTPPSDGPTPSGSRIYSLSFTEGQPDQLVKDIEAAWQQLEAKL